MGLDKKIKNWEKQILHNWLKENPERKDRFVTDVGLEIERLYTPRNLEKEEFVVESGSAFHPANDTFSGVRT